MGVEIEGAHEQKLFLMLMGANHVTEMHRRMKLATSNRVQVIEHGSREEKGFFML